MKWTENEILYLEKNYMYKTYKEIGLYLNRTENSIEKKIKSLGLSKKEVDGYTYWTDEKVKFLINNKDEFSCKELGDKLGFTEKKIIKKLSELKISKKRITKPSIKEVKKYNYGNIICTICNRGFKDLKGLQIHLTKAHSDINIESYYLENKIGNIINCHFCGDKGRFVSIVNGYRNLCTKKECINKSIPSNSIDGIVYRLQCSKEDAEKVLIEDNLNNLNKRTITIDNILKNNPLWFKHKSHNTIEYWLKRGYDEESAKENVKRVLTNLHTKTKKHRNDNPELFKDVYPIQIEFWKKKGLNEEEAKEKIRKRQSTFSKEICIEKYGEDEGLKRWMDRQEKWLDSLHKGGKLKGGYSKISQILFYDILKFYKKSEIDNVLFWTKNNEYRIKNYLYDFVDLNKKKIIEYNGDQYHANPSIYKKDEYAHPYHVSRKLTAEKIWIKDQDKLNIAIENGFSLLTIWDSEYRKNPDVILNKCLNFLNY